MTAGAELDCQACGACCFGGSRHVDVIGTDHERMTQTDHALTVFRENKCFMRMEDGHCVALLQVDGRYTCSIYERRPDMCRDFEAGDAACCYERERRGLPLPTV